MQNSNSNAFTLVELIVVITILAILGTIAFLSLQGYSNSAKNSVVMSDIKLLTSDLELYFQKVGRYPEPDGPIVDVTNLLKQGFVGDGVMRNLGDINKKPLNPFTEEEYKYSKTTYGNEYELASYIFDGLFSNNVINNANAIDETQLKYYIKGNFNGLMAYNKHGLISYSATNQNYNILSLPSLITNINDLTGTGITITYYDLEKKLVTNGYNDNQNIEFKLKQVRSSLNLPRENIEIQIMLESLVLAYTGTTSSELSQIKRLLDEKDETEFLLIGKTYIKNKISSNINLYDNNNKRNCNYDGGLFEQEYNNGAWGECIRNYCYNGFAETGTGCTWSGTFFIDANDENTYINEKQFNDKIYNNGLKNVFKNTIGTAIYSLGKIPIDTSKTYRLSGKFKSVSGTGYIYFGLVGIDEKDRSIWAPYVFRFGNEAIIQSMTDNIIYTDRELISWKGSGSLAHQRMLGFYYDGDITKLADEIYMSPDQYNGNIYSINSLHGAYSITSGNNILLNYSIPKYITDNIIPGVTKVKNHTSGSTRNYTYYQNLNPSLGEINFSGIITGELYGNSGSTFRTGTKKAKIFISKADGFELEFDEIKLEELP